MFLTAFTSTYGVSLVPGLIWRAKEPEDFPGQVAEGLNVTSAEADKVWSHNLPVALNPYFTC